MHSRGWYAVAVGFALLMGCGGKKAEPAAAGSPAGPTVYSANGWTGAERAEYYHLPEGSELMPYALVANLKSVKTGKPFLETFERFGFLPDAQSATNPYGVPVGMTVAPSRNASSTGMAMVGFSCAACHVGET